MLSRNCIEQDKVLAIQGPMTSGEMFAAGPIAQQAKVAVFGTSTTATEASPTLATTFSETPSPVNWLFPLTVKKAHDKLGFKKVAVHVLQQQ